MVQVSTEKLGWMRVLGSVLSADAGTGVDHFSFL